MENSTLAKGIVIMYHMGLSLVGCAEAELGWKPMLLTVPVMISLD